MKSTLEYKLPEEQEAFNAALHGPYYRSLLHGLIPRLTKLAYPDHGLEHGGLVVLLRQIEKQMEDLGLHREIEFDGEEGE